MSFKPEFKEIVNRLKRKESELEAIAKRKAKKRKKKEVKSGTVRSNDR